MLQGNLLTSGPPAVDASVHFEHIRLDDASWVEVARCLLHGADDVMDELIGTVAWRTGRRRMYDREIDDPRLSRWWHAGEPDPHAALAEVRRTVAGRYGVDLGGVGCNYYRDGRDSVAFHRDRELRDPNDTLVAILTLGAQRPFRIRPFGGGPSLDLAPASGDLLVMGGRCQSDWEHGVPKVGRPVGPRLSASWRWSAGGDGRPTRDGYFTSRSWRVHGPDDARIRPTTT